MPGLPGRINAWRRALPLLFVPAVVWPLTAGTAFAQRTAGSVYGVVVDETGGVLPGATVMLSGAGPIGSRATTTNTRGEYRVAGLPPGRCSLTVTLAGFQGQTLRDVEILVDRATEQNVTLRVAVSDAVVDVRAANPLVDRTTSRSATHVTQDLYAAIPTARYSFFDLIQAAPGVSPGQLDPDASVAFGSGANENQYQLDGTNLTSPNSGLATPYPNPDIVQEIEIVGTGAPAEYGNLQGAMFNVVTKSGGERHEATVSWLTQSQTLTGNNTPDEVFPFHRDHFDDVSVQAGGRVRQQKAWYYGAYQYVRDSSSQPGTEPDYPDKNQVHRVFAKLTWQTGLRNRVVVAYHDDFWQEPLPITPTIPAEAATTSKGHNPTPTAIWTNLLNDRTMLEVRAGGFRAHGDVDPLSGDLDTPGHLDTETGVASVNAQYAFKDDLSLVEISGKVTREATLGGQTHEIRAGIQYHGGRDRLLRVWPGGIQYYDSAGEPDTILTRDPDYTGGRVWNVGLFVDDTWSAGKRLTVTLGARVDHGAGNIPPLPLLDVHRAEVGTAPGLDVFSSTTIAPRVGAAFALTGDSRTVARVSYGRYYQAPQINEFFALSPSGQVIRQFGFNEATGAFDILQNELDAKTSFRVDPGLKQPVTEQYAVAVDRQVLADLALGASYIAKRGRDFTGRLDVGSQFVPVPFVDPQTGAVVTLQNRVSPPSQVDIALTSPAFYRLQYDALLLTMTKRLSHRWQALASLTWSRMQGLNSGARSPTGFATYSATVGAFGQDPNDFVNRDGLFNADRNVMWKMQGSYLLPLEILASVNWQWIAGEPYTRRLVARLDQGTRTFFAEPRDGSLRMPALDFVDVRVARRFRLGTTLRVSALIDVLNALNISTPLSLQTEVATSPNFAAPSAVPPPRRAMVGVKVEF